MNASAGDLAAVDSFFSGMADDFRSDIALVFVQRIPPDCMAPLAGLIRRHVRMELSEIEEGMRILPANAYIVPPDRELAMRDGRVQFRGAASPCRRKFPVDSFFEAVAQDREKRTIGILISGPRITCVVREGARYPGNGAGAAADGGSGEADG